MFAGTRDRQGIRCCSPVRGVMIAERSQRAADRYCAVPQMHHVQGERPDELPDQPACRRRPLRGLARLTTAPPGAVAPCPTGAAAPPCVPARSGRCPRRSAGPAAGRGGDGDSRSPWSFRWVPVSTPWRQCGCRGVPPRGGLVSAASFALRAAPVMSGGADRGPAPTGQVREPGPGPGGSRGGSGRRSGRRGRAVPRAYRARRPGRPPGRRSGPRRGRWRAGARW